MEKFKKGEYVVTLIDSGGTGKTNYCVKVKEEYSFLKVEKDCDSGSPNGNADFMRSDNSRINWRYATSDEALEYERQGKPYNVTTLQNKTQFLKDEYIVCLRPKSKDTPHIKHNWCYKQKENNQYIKPIEDCSGRTDSYSEGCSFLSKELWRYASKEEIAYYNKIDGPFNVDDLLKKEVSNYPIESEKQSVFKAGNYIVILKLLNNFSGRCAKENYCFRVRETGEYLMPVKDLEGLTNNEHRIIRADLTKTLLAWRSATPEEIRYYDKIEGPFDVTTMPINDSLSKEELLEQAKKLYPIGIEYIPLNVSGTSYSDNYKVIREPMWYNNNIECGMGYIYISALNKWADIITPANKNVPKLNENNFSEDKLLEYAKKHYPIGTKYKPLSLETGKYKGSCYDPKIYTIDYDVKKETHLDTFLLEGGYGYIYAHGNWAEIVEENSQDIFNSSLPDSVKNWIAENPKINNFSKKELAEFIVSPCNCNYRLVWSKLKGHGKEEKAEYLYNILHPNYILGIDPYEIPFGNPEKCTLTSGYLDYFEKQSDVVLLSSKKEKSLNIKILQDQSPLVLKPIKKSKLIII